MKNLFKKLLMLTLAVVMALCFSNLICRPLRTSAEEASSVDKNYAKKMLAYTLAKCDDVCSFPIFLSSDGNITEIPNTYPNGSEFINDGIGNYVENYDKSHLKCFRNGDIPLSSGYEYDIYEEITEQGGYIDLVNRPYTAFIELYYDTLEKVGTYQNLYKYYLVVNDSNATSFRVDRSLFSQDVAIYGFQYYTTKDVTAQNGMCIDSSGSELDYNRVRTNADNSLLSVHTLYRADSPLVDDMVVANPIVDDTPTTDENYQLETISVFDGSVDTKYPSNSGSKTVSGVKIDWKGMTSGTSVSSTVNGKSYKLAWKTSGSSNSIKFSIPKNVVEFTLYTVVAPNGSTAVDVNFNGNKLYTTGKSNTEYTFNTTEPLTSGDYELTFKNTPRIAEISLNLKIDPNYVEPTPDTPDESVYPLTVVFSYRDDNDAMQFIHVTPSKDENFNMDTFELPIPEITTGTFKGWYTDNETFQDEFTLDDFKKLDFNGDYDLNNKDYEVYAKIEVTEPTDPSDSAITSSTNKKTDNKGDGNGSGQSQTLCDHEIDWLKFACKKCGMSVFAIIWNTIKYWVFGILAVIAAFFMIKFAIKLVKKE